MKHLPWSKEPLSDKSDKPSEARKPFGRRKPWGSTKSSSDVPWGGKKRKKTWEKKEREKKAANPFQEEMPEADDGEVSVEYEPMFAKDKKTERKRKPLNLDLAAVKYLGRYPCSRAHFLFVMRRKLERRGEVASDADLDHLATSMQDRGLLDDALFARGVTASYHRRGQSLSKIRLKLRDKKLTPDVIDKAVADLVAEYASKSESDFTAAKRAALQKKLGRWGNGDPKERAKQKQRDLAALARRGFSYEIAMRALNEVREEYLEQE